MDLFLATIGTAGLGGTLIYVGTLALNWWKERHSHEQITTASDREVAKELITQLRGMLQDEREENARLSGRNEELEIQIAMAHQRQREQRREYEREIEELRNQLNEVSKKLNEMQAKLKQMP